MGSAASSWLPIIMLEQGFKVGQSLIGVGEEEMTCRMKSHLLVFQKLHRHDGGSISRVAAEPTYSAAPSMPFSHSVKIYLIRKCQASISQNGYVFLRRPVPAKSILWNSLLKWHARSLSGPYEEGSSLDTIPQ